MLATWNVEELMATALPSSVRGTMFGRKDWEAGRRNARATPSRPSTANIGIGLPIDSFANSRRSSAQVKNASKQSRMMRRRS
jgi:hypothetical protein